MVDVMSLSNWATSEFEGIELGDKRLTDRLITITDQFASSTQSPINKACEGWGDTKAAYRFFQNDNINYIDIVKHHSLLTTKRADSEEVVLAIQDTTYFNYTSHPKTTGLGLLSRFTGKHKKDILTLGLYMHTTLALNTDGVPLGLLNQKISSREVRSEESIELKRRSHGTTLPIEEKESVRWLDSMKATASLFSGKNKKVVTIADREADIYDLFVAAEELSTHYLIRAARNRRINKTAIHSENSGELLWDFMSRQIIEGEIEVDVPCKGKTPKRKAACSIKCGKINVLPPRSYKGVKPKSGSLTLYVVQVVESSPPEGSEKIEWVLYTNIPVNSYGDAIEKIKWYCLRWRIEVYFKVIKSGFNVESCRLQSADRLIRYLAVVSIVAWRVYWLTLASRTPPSANVSEFLNEHEWKVLFVKYNPLNKIPQSAPPIKKLIAWVAQLGGFLARKGDGDPGVVYMWRGLEKLSDMVAGVQLRGIICG